MKWWQKMIAWAIGIGFAYFLLTDPAGAAHTVSGLLNDLKGIGNSLSVFFQSL